MEIKKSFDLKFIFNDNIERVWSFIRDPCSLLKANTEIFVSMKPIEGNDLWSVKSKCILYLPTGLEVELKCVDVKSEPHNKKLCYSGQLKDALVFKVQYSLFDVSSDNRTVVVIDFCDISTTYPNIFEALESSAEIIFNKLNEHIQNSTLALFQNEGAIINKNIGEIWNLFSNWQFSKQLTAVHSDALIILNNKNKVLWEPGTIFKLIVMKEINAFFRVKSVNNNPSESKWEFVIEYLSSGIFYSKELRIYLISINNNSTQISICHHFLVPETPERIQQMSKIKKKILIKLKNMAENPIFQSQMSK